MLCFVFEIKREAVLHPCISSQLQPPPQRLMAAVEVSLSTWQPDTFHDQLVVNEHRIDYLRDWCQTWPLWRTHCCNWTSQSFWFLLHKISSCCSYYFSCFYPNTTFQRIQWHYWDNRKNTRTFLREVMPLLFCFFFFSSFFMREERIFFLLFETSFVSLASNLPYSPFLPWQASCSHSGLKSLTYWGKKW